MRKKKNSMGIEFNGIALSTAPSHILGNGEMLHPFHQLNDGFFYRIPYPSLIAFVMCFIGTILFFLMMFWSFNGSIGQVRMILNRMDIYWLDKVSYNK